MSSPVVVLSGSAAIEDVVAIADRAAVARLDPAALEAVARLHGEADRIAAVVPAYGRSTGVGANRGVAVVGDDGHALRLLRSHAADAGPVLPARAVRAMLAVRLNQLCAPGSGIDPAVLVALQRMLEADALPEVRATGALGTGDLTALAGTGLTLLGERPAAAPLPPMAPWGADSALAFISSNALTIGRSALAVDALRRLERAGRAAAALALVAVAGSAQAFSATAAEAAAAPGVHRVAATVRALLAGVDQPAARIQDPFGLRVFPHTQGVLVQALDVLARQVTASLNVAQENPLYRAGPPAPGTVTHHGGFFQAALTLDLETAALALARSATTGLSRVRMLNEPQHPGDAAFLAAGPAGSSGLMMLEYVAAGALADVRAAAHPASLATVTLSRGAEDDAAFTTQAVAGLEAAVEAARIVLACELVGVVRLLRMRGIADSATGPLGALLSVLSALPRETGDRDLRGDLATAAAMIDPLAAVVARHDRPEGAADVG